MEPRKTRTTLRQESFVDKALEAPAAWDALTKPRPNAKIYGQWTRKIPIGSRRARLRLPQANSMKLVKYQDKNSQVGAGVLTDDGVRPMDLSRGTYRKLSDILEADDPAACAMALVQQGGPMLALADARLLAPIDDQEVWAAGVTYTRSRKARMEESVGAASFYDKVYEAARPELFFKATPHRVSGDGQNVRIRRDAKWNVPEPELTLVINSKMKLVAFTAGNDMSSRDIEGENPLYLPQAKVYDQSCALGPCLTLAASMLPREATNIRLVVRRAHQVAFEGTTSAGRMARTFEDLMDYLGRDQTFPAGVFLLTGTGIVPGDSFTLQPGDVVEITIDGIGTLTNTVVQA